MYNELRKIFKENPDVSCKKGVLHVGAHKCEEAAEYAAYPKVMWIDGNDELCAGNPNIVNALISDKDDEEVEFIVTNNYQSSSILELKEHLEEYPNILETKRVKKKTVTLDTLFDRLQCPHDSFDLLVIDIQGAELLALKGAKKILPNINAILTEVNVRELYEGCVLLPDLDAFLKENGFERVYLIMRSRGWGDAIYVRRN